MSSKQTTSSGDRSVDALRADITDTRTDLDGTVRALADKADVTGRAKASAQQAATTVRDTTRHAAVQVRDTAEDTVVKANESVRRQPTRWAAAGVVAVAAVVGVLAWRRRTRPTPKTRAARAWRMARNKVRR
jgi:ElaB/YqjD/DUF883 family membrane-anchored ribosome-binding protein